jgi:hypothetical protein
MQLCSTTAEEGEKMSFVLDDGVPLIVAFMSLSGRMMSLSGRMTSFC